MAHGHVDLLSGGTEFEEADVAMRSTPADYRASTGARGEEGERGRKKEGEGMRGMSVASRARAHRAAKYSCKRVDIASAAIVASDSLDGKLWSVAEGKWIRTGALCEAETSRVRPDDMCAALTTGKVRVHGWGSYGDSEAGSVGRGAAVGVDGEGSARQTIEVSRFNGMASTRWVFQRRP
ncbi:hypothetical protein B0H19DRAFT_1074529 [Mycena capillaripes]|nr:hypothetical protein B0H19DRAFT_1074529 [Mycena capillaripes]